MSLFSFYDSNSINKSNYPGIKATVDTYNGYQFKLSDGTAVAHTNAAGAKTAEIYFMYNIIDKPEIENTGDYHVGVGEYIRAWRLKDFVGEKFNMSSDLITDTYSGISEGDKIIPRATDDETDTMKWKKTDNASAYGVYLEVVDKSTFGAFTYQRGAGTIPGGYIVKVCANDLT